MKKTFIYLLTILFLISTTNAKTLTIGLASDALSMDPYETDEVATSSILSNIFDGLVSFDKDLKIHPNLATSWTHPEPTIWILKLRKNVTFHNGHIFNAKDVKFSFNRIKHWAKSGFQSKVNMLVSASIIDDYTVKLVTKKPFPLFLKKLTFIKILDKETLEGKSDKWIANNPIGTGPYALVSWHKGNKISMKANPNYWRGKAFFDTLFLKPLPNDTSRVNAILNGKVDIINRVPVTEVHKVKKHTDINLYKQPGLRLIYLQMDQFRDISPYIKTTNGKNPLKDLRVRQALYYGIDEESIVKYIMHGFAKPAAQFSPKTVFGSDNSISRATYSPQKAKKLLTEAGYPNGFEIQLDAPNNRYVNDVKIAEALAESLAKIGIKVKVNATEKSKFFAKISSLNTSFFLIGWESSDGDSSSMLDACIHSFDKEEGYGRYNYGRFSNKRVDQLIKSSEAIMQDTKRLHYLQEVQRIALLEEQCIIPLHFQVDLYAAQHKIIFHPRLDGHVWAYDIQEQ